MSSCHVFEENAWRFGPAPTRTELGLSGTAKILTVPLDTVYRWIFRVAKWKVSLTMTASVYGDYDTDTDTYTDKQMDFSGTISSIMAVQHRDWVPDVIYATDEIAIQSGIGKTGDGSGTFSSPEDGIEGYDSVDYSLCTATPTMSGTSNTFGAISPLDMPGFMPLGTTQGPDKDSFGVILGIGGGMQWIENSTYSNGFIAQADPDFDYAGAGLILQDVDVNIDGIVVPIVLVIPAIGPENVVPNSVIDITDFSVTATEFFSYGGRYDTTTGLLV
jgi:hypothetical protein